MQAMGPGLARATSWLPRKCRSNPPQGQSYGWPDHGERYSRYVIYSATTQRGGNASIALGRAERFSLGTSLARRITTD